MAATMHEAITVPGEQEVIAQLAALLEGSARASAAADVFRVGLSGGSVLSYLCAAIPRLPPSIDLSRWRFYFCDERYVAVDDADSTFGQYQSQLLPAVADRLHESQFAAIDLTLPLEACAAAYEQRLRSDFGLAAEGGAPPAFDLLLLGMGPDGHTCSLFPGHELLAERQRWIAPIGDSPKPPPKRVTMTLPLINAAKCCVFTLCGSGKADMVKRVFTDNEMLPAAMVAPTQGRLVIILDEPAAASLGAAK